MTKDSKNNLDPKEDLNAKLDTLIELVEGMAGSTAASLTEVHEEIAELKEDVAKLDFTVNNLQNRLDVLAGLDRRVEKLTKDMVRVKGAVGIIN